MELFAAVPGVKLSLLLLSLFVGGSVGLLELLSSVGCGGHAKNKWEIISFIKINISRHSEVQK